MWLQILVLCVVAQDFVEDVLTNTCLVFEEDLECVFHPVKTSRLPNKLDRELVICVVRRGFTRFELEADLFSLSDFNNVASLLPLLAV